MRRLWILMAALVAFGGIAAFAPAAGAATSSNDKFCAAINKLGDTSSKSLKGSAAKNAAAQLRAAAKVAPGNVKSAMNTIADYTSKLGSVSSASDLAKLYTTNGYKSYGKALTVYMKYVVTCATSGLSDTTTTTSG